MQTFLPYPDFAASAKVLDRQRPGLDANNRFTFKELRAGKLIERPLAVGDRVKSHSIAQDRDWRIVAIVRGTAWIHASGANGDHLRPLDSLVRA